MSKGDLLREIYRLALECAHAAMSWANTIRQRYSPCRVQINSNKKQQNACRSLTTCYIVRSLGKMLLLKTLLAETHACSFTAFQ